MTTEFVFFWVPIIAVWLIVVLDILVRGDYRVITKILWIVSITILWPLMILYLLLRPVAGRITTGAAVRRRKADAHQQLVVAVLNHDAGLTSEAEFRQQTAALRAAKQGADGTGDDG